MIELDDHDAFEGLDALIEATEASPEFDEESLVAEAQSLIVSAMAQQRVTRSELAQLMGVSKARVSQMLSSACTNLTLRLLGRAGHALGLKFKLVRAEDVIARRTQSGTWCIGSPWDEPDWQAGRIGFEDRVANENRRPVDVTRAAGLIRQAILEAA